MSKSLFRGVRLSLVATVVAAMGALGLTACNNCCGCAAGPAVYRKPCCAGQTAPRCPTGCGAPTAAPAPMAQPMPAPAAPAGGTKACGAGKCG